MVPTFASKFARPLTCAAILTLTLVTASPSALAQYKLTKLTANQPGKAKHTDPLLVNGWGLAYGPGNPFWVSDAGNGWSTLVSALHFSWTETPSFWAGRDEMRLMVTGVTEMFSYRQNMKMYRSGILRYGETVLFGANLS